MTTQTDSKNIRRSKVRTSAETARLVSMLKAFKKCFNAALDANDFPALHYGRQTVVASRYGVSQSAARKWVEGECLPDIIHLVLIADDLGISTDALLGRNSSISAFPGKRKRKTTIVMHENTSSIDVGDENAQLGTVEFDSGLLKHTLRLQQNGVEMFKVTTDSMSPLLNINDIAFVDTSVSEISDGGLYLFYTPSGKIMIRRATYQLNGSILLTCNNSSYKSIEVKRSDIKLGDDDKEGKFKLKLFGSIPWRITAPL